MTNIAEERAIPWDLRSLFKAPATYPATTEEPGVTAFLYDSVPYRGKPTRIFAYYGVPEGAGNEKRPAMVLIHGGSGSAYAEWVRQWTARGYIAIAMDHFGNIPALAPQGEPYGFEKIRNEEGGPNGGGGFEQIDEPSGDQWSYHAVAAAILANSLLRTFPEVDADQIGVTGISWGGFITSIVAGLDDRFRFAVPVYGCGYLAEDSGWPNHFRDMGEARARKWNDLWDPSQYISGAQMPMLWVNGTNDDAFPLSSWQKTLKLAQGVNTLSIQGDMPHGQHEGAVPAEIGVFANGILGLGKPLAAVKPIELLENNCAQVTFQSKIPIVKAELYVTADDGPWTKRRWQVYAARLNDSISASARIPTTARAFFFNLTDERGLVVSSEYLTRD